jgi:hypothetical protein
MAHINVIARKGAAGFLEHAYLLLSRTLNHAKSYGPGCCPALPQEPVMAAAKSARLPQSRIGT